MRVWGEAPGEGAPGGRRAPGCTARLTGCWEEQTSGYVDASGTKSTLETRLLSELLRSFQAPGPRSSLGPGHRHWGLSHLWAWTTRSDPFCPVQTSCPFTLRAAPLTCCLPTRPPAPATAPTLCFVKIARSGPAQSPSLQAHTCTHTHACTCSARTRTLGTAHMHTHMHILKHMDAQTRTQPHAHLSALF